MRAKHWNRLLTAAGACALGGSLHAATNIVDFNSDPLATGVYTEQAGATSGEWRPSGGKSGGATDGYLSVTDAKDGQRGVLLFKDLENGLIVKSFKFECDLRMGGGNDAPADGFSINYASVDDPVFSGGAFAGTDDETNLPEEGTQTGLAIGFDSWQSGAIGGKTDVVGLSIRVGGVLKAQLPVPLSGTNVFFATDPQPGAAGALSIYDPVPYRNLATNNPNYRYSMQTGARGDVNGDGVVDGADENFNGGNQVDFSDPTWSLWITNLTWEHFIAEVLDNGNVKITWKGNEITPPGGLATGFTPIAGRLIFAARTGGNNQVHHVDNITLVTQPFTSAVVQNVTGNASGVNISILDQGTTILDTNTLVIKVNGATVTPNVVSRANSTTTIRYNANPLLPVGTTTVQITFKDNFGVSTDVTRTFTTGAYTTANAALAVPAGSVDTTKPGFTVRTQQLPIGRGPGDGNRIPMAERQLRNGFIDPTTGLPYDSLSTAGPDAGGTFTVQYINWEQNAPTASSGNFTAAGTGTQAVADDLIPGVAAGDPNNIVAESVAYLQIPAGYYTLGFNSDDGFAVNFGRGLHEVYGFGQNLGNFDGGKGSSDVLFDVYVPTAGIYPIRALWWEGGGGASAEFFYVDNTTGAKILVNDVAHGSVIKAYTTATTGRRPAVTTVVPEVTQRFVAPDAEVAAWIQDGDITLGTASLAINGTNVTATSSKLNGVTKVSFGGSIANLLRPLDNTATLIYSFTEGGSPVSVTNSWTFRVLGYGVIPAALKVPTESIASANTPGAKAVARQIQRRLGNTNQGDVGTFPGDANRLPKPEYLLKDAYFDPATGLPYPNTAIPSAFDGTFTYDVFYINFNDGLTGTAPNRTITAGDSGIFGGESSLPGLPAVGGAAREDFSNGGLDNIVVEFTTYLQLKAGATLFAVNSDDGFIATAAANVHDTAGVRLGFYTGGRGNSNPLPQPTNGETPTPGTSNGNSAFAAVALEDGIYPIRVLYWQGGGGVNVEFLTIDKSSGVQTLVGDTSLGFGVQSYDNSTADDTRAWAVYPPSPTPWDNRIQQEKVGLPKFWGNTPGSVNSGDIYNDSDSRRPFADSEIGAVFANGAGKTITLKLNGAVVTPTITTSGTNTTVAYKPNPALASGSVNTATLGYEGLEYSWTWTAPTYTNAPASAVLPASQATGATSGFLVKVAQASTGQPNTVVGAEKLIAGGSANVATNNAARTDGRYLAPYINYNNNPAAPLGNFQTNALAGWPFPKVADVQFPGLNTTVSPNREQFALEITAYLKFDAAGYYKFGVNGDDGWAVTVGAPGVTNGTPLFTIDRGGGAADIPFSFTIPAAGLYPIRLLYYQGGGGANVEFFSYDDAGVKHLINDPNDANAIKAFAELAGSQIRITSTTLAGGQINITWTGGGELVSATTITGPWTGTGDTDGSYSETIPAGAATKFYQVRKATP